MFNVDRIQQCRLTADHYAIPEDFDLATYLGSTWGVLRGACLQRSLDSRSTAERVPRPGMEVISHAVVSLSATPYAPPKHHKHPGHPGHHGH